MRGFPFILFRTLTSELGRLLITSTVAIVVVLAFGAALKPLADGEIGPEDTIRLMALAIVPMLQFALPFASSFAATMTFHRFASENEADAAMVSGVPHRVLLTPAVAVGLVLSLGIGAMMMSVIPTFLREMESIITRNVTEIFIARIERGESIGLGDFQIYADSVQSTVPDQDEGSGAFEVLVLSGVLVVQTDSESGATTSANARRVFMWFFDDSDEHGNAIAVQLVFEGAAWMDDSGMSTTYNTRVDSQRIRIPGQLRDDPKFLTYSELQSRKRNPELMNFVDRSRRLLKIGRAHV